MKKEDLNPYVRFFRRVAGTPLYSKMICAYDFRLFYVINSKITFEFEDCKHILKSGDVIVIGPGVPYKLSFETCDVARYYLINFDFLFDGNYRQAKTPVPKEHYDKKQIFSKDYIEPFSDVFILHDCLVIESDLNEMQEMNIADFEERALMLSALMKKILTKLIIKNKKSANSSKAAQLIQNVKDYICINHDKKLTNISVAKHFGYHPYYLNNLFSGYERITLHNYIDKIRIITAKEKLGFTEKAISVISSEMGFSDCSHFSAFFKKATGMTPKEYRNLCK